MPKSIPTLLEDSRLLQATHGTSELIPAALKQWGVFNSTGLAGLGGPITARVKEEGLVAELKSILDLSPSSFVVQTGNKIARDVYPGVSGLGRNALRHVGVHIPILQGLELGVPTLSFLNWWDYNGLLRADARSSDQNVRNLRSAAKHQTRTEDLSESEVTVHNPALYEVAFRGESLYGIWTINPQTVNTTLGGPPLLCFNLVTLKKNKTYFIESFVEEADANDWQDLASFLYGQIPCGLVPASFLRASVSQTPSKFSSMQQGNHPRARFGGIERQLRKLDILHQEEAGTSSFYIEVNHNPKWFGSIARTASWPLTGWSRKNLKGSRSTIRYVTLKDLWDHERSPEGSHLICLRLLFGLLGYVPDDRILAKQYLVLDGITRLNTLEHTELMQWAWDQGVRYVQGMPLESDSVEASPTNRRYPATRHMLYSGRRD